jgi:hypothetical protein
MAEDSGKTAGETPAAKSAADGSPAANRSNAHLPEVESPPLSPAGETSAAPEPALESTDFVTFRPDAASRRANPRFKPSYRRNALMAASVLIAATLGTFVGLVTGLGFADQKNPKIDLAAHQAEREAMQRSIATLGNDIAALKTSIAAAKALLHGEVAKLTERLDGASEITGSIPTPPVTVAAPLPQARPAAVSHPALVRDWFIRFVRDGYVYVQEGRGDIYQVQLGVPLPGVGPVQDVKRQDGRWLVVTPKGLIVSLRDRRYFERF